MNLNTSSKSQQSRGYCGNGTAVEGDEPFPSLSDFHDYEPNLEFDDTEIQHAPADSTEQNELPNLDEHDLLASPVHSDFTEDNFDDLRDPCDEHAYDSMSYPEVGACTGGVATSAAEAENFDLISRRGIVDVKGDDQVGRKIIVVYAYKLPPTAEMDHQQFLRYLMYTLNKYVEQDYSLVYFHYGFNSKNKPSMAWLYKAYSAFDRNYKKNLKALYIVHPTAFLKWVLHIFRPVISGKFGKKINYINSLEQLNADINLDKLSIPEDVKRYDMERNGRTVLNVQPELQSQNPTMQFGSTLLSIKEKYGQIIPPIVKQCVEYLNTPDALETEGLFRRSANVSVIASYKKVANEGETVPIQNPHEAAVLLKTFFRELREPLLTFDLYDEVVSITWGTPVSSFDEHRRSAYNLIVERLPEDNYKVLKYLVNFLTTVMDRVVFNKMSAQNLAIVFGPNLIWSENTTMSLQDISPINMFLQFLLQHYADIFIV